MNYTRAREELKPRLKDYVESITEKSKGANMYVCPICGSGKGRNHTGAFSIDPKKPTRWKCFRCGRGGDIFDLIGKVENITDPLNQLKRAGEIYGIEVQGKDQNQPRNKQYTHMDIHTDTYTQTREEKAQEEKITAYLEECQRHLEETTYPQERGLSKETAKLFNLGYDPNFKTKDRDTDAFTVWQAFIIPTGYYSYTVRNTDPEASKNNRYRNRGQSTPFNGIALEKAQKPIFIVEGELDALSIIEVGGEAIGLGSTANIDLFINNYLKETPPAQPLVIALDNDETGIEATAKLEEKLTDLGIKHYILNPAGEYKDANEALTKDREAFTQAVAQAEKIEEEALEAEREEYLKTSSYSHLQEFINGIAESANTPATPTGFTNLDKALDGGLYEGLYVLGAITSLGKTTLALQIADQIADSGRDVLIFSLEQSRAELMSKSISRLTLLDVLDNGGDTANAKTNRGITAGARWEHYTQTEKDIIQRAITSYGKYARHIFIHEGIGNIGVEEIKETVRAHQIFTGQAPVVIVDYVQILAPYNVRATDKQNTDKAVLELKRISRDYKIPVIGISSFNRASYKEKVDLEAFKESGSLEYGSDVLIGLQFKGAGKKDFDSTEAKQKNPREVELVILKNRNGKTGAVIDLDYHPLFNYFKER